ncbi:argininosuccinate synthase [Photorhabdus heterorhabditis]|uniref:argininosuccinate synthase n=1 Tax=Photorhabdus heterorhabditis TaxID=880156 RepID=A0ABR5KCB3_9GAMM|nr:argininosuccinate synthase domain-containing protein [Photorhabdus heterorhabditis]KOY62239.1 argininosuccinate synthase [Photorhabdus heterorhabditis]MBS9441516.1 argininosuccinate synthase [Photorhabdus heterorhabditis]
MNSNSVLVIYYNRRYNPLIIRSLKYEFKEVISLYIDEGKVRDIEDIEDIELECMVAGADKFIYKDYRIQYVENFISKAIKANATYQNGCFLSTELSRSAIAEAAVEVANDLNIDYIAHQFSGNDQVRIDMNIEILNKIPIAALREFKYDENIVYNYAMRYGIPQESDCNNPYSIHENIGGFSIECSPLENSEMLLPEDIKEKLFERALSATEPIFLSLDFENGIPISLDGEKKSLYEIIEILNEIGKRLSIGIFEIVEDGVVGLETRAIYQSPAAHILITAHRDLECYCSNCNENWFKEIIDKKWGELVYSGLWYNPLLTHLNHFIDSMNQNVNGEVTLELGYKYVNVCFRTSKTRIYGHNLAIYNRGGLYSQNHTEVFEKKFNIYNKQSAKPKMR